MNGPIWGRLPHTVGRALFPTFVVLFVISLFGTLLQLAMPVYMIQVYGRVLPTGSLDTLVSLLLIFVASMAFVVALDVFRTLYLRRVANRLFLRLGTLVFWQGLVQDKQSIGRSLPKDKENAALAQTLISRQHQLMQTPALPALFDVLWAPIFFIVLWAYHPLLGVVAISSLFAFILVSLLGATWKDANSPELNLAQNKTSNLQQSAELQSQLNCDGKQKASLTKRWWNEVNRSLVLKGRHEGRASLATASQRGLRLTAQGVILTVSAYLVVTQNLNPAMIIVSSILLGRCLDPAVSFIGSIKLLLALRKTNTQIDHLLLKHRVEQKAHRIQQVKGTEQQKTKPQDAVPTKVIVDKTTAANDRVVPLFREGEDLEGNRQPLLEMRNLTLFHPLQPGALLHNLGFSLFGGQAIAIGGATAAGKTSTLRLLAGQITPNKGLVLHRGRALGNMPREEVEQHCAFVGQIPNFVPGTILSNIANFDADVDLLRAEMLCDSLNLTECIGMLPKGLDTEIRESFPAMFSVSQRQMLSYARALYTDPQIILLDEPFAFLDEKDSAALKACLQQHLAKGSGLIYTVKRIPDVLGFANKVFHLKSAELTEIPLESIAA